MNIRMTLAKMFASLRLYGEFADVAKAFRMSAQQHRAVTKIMRKLISLSKFDSHKVNRLVQENAEMLPY